MNKKPYIIALCFFIIDLISKQIVITLIPLHKSIMVIKNFFYLTYTRNTGAAFSILEDARILLLIITVIALFFINKFMNKEEIKGIENFIYGIIIGGILGNLFDRVIYGYVIDFLDFQIFKFDFVYNSNFLFNISFFSNLFSSKIFLAYFSNTFFSFIIKTL